jgi:hypothetical protein
VRRNEGLRALEGRLAELNLIYICHYDFAGLDDVRLEDFDMDSKLTRLEKEMQELLVKNWKGVVTHAPHVSMCCDTRFGSSYQGI